MKTVLFNFMLFTSIIFSLFPLPDFWQQKPDDELIEEIITAMTAEELLGQVFFLGYNGAKVPSYLKSWIRDRNLGGVKLFTRNVFTLTQLARDIELMQRETQKNRFKIPLFMATDQEGGWVIHIRNEMSETPGNLALGACGLPGDAYLTGYYLGMELRALGINMNFAPDLDIYSNPLASAVGPRGFSSDPVQVGVMGLAYYKGMAGTGVICTAKHFPGHGGSVTDSHGFLPVVDISYEGLWQRELVPYRFLIKEGVPAIMSCHVAFPQVSGKKIPASLCAILLHDVLRDRLEFQGMVITDDLEMYGVRADGTDMPTVCRKALEAGNDAVLIAHTPFKQEKSWQQLKKIIKEDENFRQMVIQAVRRILKIKMQFFKGQDAFPIFPDVDAVKQSIPAKYAPQFFLENACRSVTVVRDQNLPLKTKEKERILIVSNYYGFLREGLKRYPQAKIFHITDFSSAKEDSLIKAASAFDRIIYCLGNKSGLAALKKMKHLKNKLIIISILTPVYLMEVPWVRTALAVYGESDDTFKAGFAVLAGDFQAEGQMPLDFLKEQVEK